MSIGEEFTKSGGYIPESNGREGKSLAEKMINPKKFRQETVKKAVKKLRKEELLTPEKVLKRLKKIKKFEKELREYQHPVRERLKKEIIKKLYKGRLRMPSHIIPAGYRKRIKVRLQKSEYNNPFLSPSYFIVRR